MYLRQLSVALESLKRWPYIFLNTGPFFDNSSLIDLSKRLIQLKRFILKLKVKPKKYQMSYSACGAAVAEIMSVTVLFVWLAFFAQMNIDIECHCRRRLLKVKGKFPLPLQIYGL